MVRAERPADAVAVLQTGPLEQGAGLQRGLRLDGRNLAAGLSQIGGNDTWQLFRVAAPTSLAEPNAVVDRAEQGEMILQVKKAGRVLVRIPYSPWLSIVDAEGKSLKPPQETEESRNRPEGEPKTYVNVNGCLTETEEDAQGDKWTELLAPKAGTYRLAAPYQFPRGTPCPEELR